MFSCMLKRAIISAICMIATVTHLTMTCVLALRCTVQTRVEPPTVIMAKANK